LPKKPNLKLFEQCIRLFTILRKVSCLAYKLALLLSFKIYLVIFVAYFKLALKDKDIFNRLKLNI